MATVFNERPNSRESSTNPESITMQYVLAGLSTDDAVCKAFAISATPQRMLSYTGAMLWRQDLKMEPQGGDVWYVTVPYGPLAPPTPLEMKWAFSTTGGTKKITQAIAHVGSWGVLQNANYLPPPDHQGTIGVDEDGNVEGCEIVIPQFKWTETWQLPVSMVPWNYADLCEALTGTVCDAYFRGRGPGRVRFDGAEGMQSSKSSNIVELTYSFASGQDVTGLTIGNCQAADGTLPQKGAWQYLWIEYQTTADTTAKRRAKQPRTVHVEQVYYAQDFSQLGLGTGPLALMGTT